MIAFSKLCIIILILTHILDVLANQKVEKEQPSDIVIETEIENSDKELAHSNQANTGVRYASTREGKNYASAECAKVVETNPEAKKASYIINGMIDDYMLNPCKAKVWFVIELCETIQATHIEIANYELFSSTPKDFTVYFSDIYPALDWKLIGQFTANDSRTLQTFDLNQVGFGKFVRVELHTHYGNEHYCPISEVRIYGASMVDEYEKSENLVENLEEQYNLNNKTGRKMKRKTSAYRVYKSIMTDPHICSLSQEKKCNQEMRLSDQQKAPTFQTIILPQPTQQPVVNRTTPLKPSIFVELSNKVKALETNLKLQKEYNEQKQRETEMRFEKVEKDNQEFRTFITRLTALVVAYLVYNMFLDLML